MAHTVHFTKMHGAGNDYIYVYLPDNPVADPRRASIMLSRPHFGIGSDGLILIDRCDTKAADFRMRIFNNDGSEARMCGNGIRCVGKYVYDHGLTRDTTLRIQTLSGIKQIRLHVRDGQVEAATVDMGVPEVKDALGDDRRRLRSEEEQEGLRVKDEGLRVKGVRVSMGNPHYVCFVPDVMSVDVASEGSCLEYEAMPGERCNVEFATLRPDGTIRMRVWERGSGITLACGTGACATAVAASLLGLTGRTSQVQMDGGTLSIAWAEDGHVLMTGPAETVFEGTVTLNYEL